MLALCRDRALASSAASALAIAGLTTTGPGDRDLRRRARLRATCPAAAQAIFCAAMIVGRMEALVIVALFNPT